MKQNYIFSGSSKHFYSLEKNRYLMAFKDDIHGNNCVDSIQGTGKSRKEFTYYFYKFLEKQGIATHLDETQGQSALQDDGLVVKACQPIKIELLVRKVARGHWVDAHKIPLFEGGTVFDEPIVELCVKMKKTFENGNLVDDPRINGSLAVALHKSAIDDSLRNNMLINKEEVAQAEQLALSIYRHYEAFLQKHNWVLEDFKFEIGVLKEHFDRPGPRQFILIDEISPDCSRIRDPKGNSLTKDLFRQKRPKEEIVYHYERLTQAIKEELK